MEKINNKEIIDVVKFSEDKLIFVQKNPLSNSSNFKPEYYIINFSSGEKEAVTKKAYLLKKFGQAYEKICKTIADYIQCQTIIFEDKSVLIVFPNGQAGLFGSDGELIWTKEFSYNSSPVHSLAEDNGAFWCVCTNENCVIRYSADKFALDIRIGSKDASTFSEPHFVSSDEENIFVCCKNSVRKIDKSSLIVSDVEENIPYLQRYYRFKDVSIFCCSDGLYFDK
ncbi:MAG: hypothetical protein IKR97_01440 [Eubacterium sp.]|nr:hypothetical protein [Eubacterium sp.]